MVKNSSSEMQKGLWDDKEDGKLSKQQGTGNWTTFSKRSGQRRSGKSCREKWSNNNNNSNNQKSDPRQKSFTPQEEELVIQLHAAIGSRWPIIAQQLPGRTDNDVKVLWNSKLRKKLSAMGIDPVTHKPFSQILADYGNIGAFPKARTRFASLSKDLKNAIIFKSEQAQKDTNPQTFPNHFVSSTSPPKQDVYSQLQAVNFITEASNYAKTDSNLTRECVSAAPDVSSLSWSDFFLEDAFLAEQENGGKLIVQCCDEGKAKCGAIEGVNDGGFEASSSSNGSSFVDAMLERQDAMFSQMSCFSEEPFYY